MQHLTEEQKLVLIGKFVEDRSNQDVADLLDKSEGAVKSLQHRALAALRRAIEREGCYE
jgi:RNA polymerase sigma-70 factor (ECF subfamily)